MGEILMDKNYTIETMFTEEQLDVKIRELGSKISEDYKNKDMHIICILRGAVVFMAELIKRIDNYNLDIDFMSVSSYGNEMTTSGNVKILKDLDEPIEGKDVLIVEDIIDTGRTLAKLVEILKTRNPKSIEICTLLDKPEKREVKVNVKYVGFKIPDRFIVGFGIDYAQKYRGLPYVGCVKFEDEK